MCKAGFQGIVYRVIDCNLSSGSIDKLPHHVTITESQHRGMVMFIGRKATDVDTCNKAIQTDAKSYTRALKRGVSNGLSQCDSDTCDKAIQTDTKSYTCALKQ